MDGEQSHSSPTDPGANATEDGEAWETCALSGERRRMLADVLKSPDSLEGLMALVSRLMDFTQAHLDRYAELAEAFPAMAPSLAPWREKAARTLGRLADVREQMED